MLADHSSALARHQVNRLSRARRTLLPLAILALVTGVVGPFAPEPVEAATTSSADTLAEGTAHACALSPDGVIRCWGDNTYGQLGNGTTVASLTPVAVLATVGGAPLTSATTITAGAYHTCARLSNGSVKCWGRNASGQLGDGTTTNRSVPVVVKRLAGATSIGAGAAHTCARLSSGLAKCWGLNASGQLGDGTTSRRLTAVTVKSLSAVKAITAGANHTCAITGSAKTVKCWGNNSSGQLGIGSTSRKLTATTVRSITGATSIAAGSAHTCAVAGSTGAVKCWGGNKSGQLGDGSTTRRLQAVAVRTTPTAALTRATAVAAGAAFSCARLTSGVVKCWGANASAQLGDGTTSTRLRAVTNAGLSGTTRIAAGASHACAQAASSGGGVACWGSNGSGQLGDGTTGNRPLAVTTVGLTPAGITIGSSRDVLPPDGTSTADVRAKVVDMTGIGVCGAKVTFAVNSGDVSVAPATRYATCEGAATAVVDASATPGMNEIAAQVAGTGLSAVVAVEEATEGTVAVVESPGVSVTVTVLSPAGATSLLSAEAVSIASAAPVEIGSMLDVTVTTDASASPILLVDGLLATPTILPTAAAAAVGVTHYTVPVTGHQELTAGLYELRPGVKQLDADTLAILTTVSDDKLTLGFTGTTPQLATLIAGDVIVGDDSRFPNGLRAAISTVETVGGTTTLVTTPADMQMIFGRMSIDYDSRVRDTAGGPSPLGPVSGAGVAATGFDIPIPIGAIEFTVDPRTIADSWLSGSATITLAEPRLVGCWEWDWATLKCAEASLKGGVTLEADLGLQVTKEIDFVIVAYQLLGAVPIAPFVAIVPTWGAGIHVEGAITVGAKWTWSATMKAGARYYDGVGLSVVAEATSTGSGSLIPAAEASVSVKVRPVMHMDLTVDAICGAGITVGLPAAEVEVGLLPAKTWKLTVGAEISPNVACFFGHKVFDGVMVGAHTWEGTWGPPPPAATLPVVGAVTLDPASVTNGQATTVWSSASDPDGIASAEYRVGQGAWQQMSAWDGAYGGGYEDVYASFTIPTAGTYQVCVRATDALGYSSATSNCETLTVVQNPAEIGGGVLTSITISPDLNCSVTHENSATSEIFYGVTACGTFLAAGGILYGPASIPAGSSATPLTGWTPVSQAGSGSGTRDDPWLLTTTVEAGASGITVIERDSYVQGDPYWTVSTEVVNGSGAPSDAILYRAADCYIGSDYGFGAANAVTGAVQCVNDYTGRWLEWYPLTIGSHYYEAFYGDVWARIGAQLEMPDTTRGSEYIDNGAALSWRSTIPAGGSRTFAHRLQVIWPATTSPAGTLNPLRAAAAPALSPADARAWQAAAKAREGDIAGARLDFQRALSLTTNPDVARKIRALRDALSIQP
jgi:alpha-tubulin suppressor-like RCC1 family protein